MDVVFNHHGRRIWVDVAVTAASTTSEVNKQIRAARAGAAAAREEDVKRNRYPGPDLMPFVLETLGQPGDSVGEFLRLLAPGEPTERSEVLASAWQALSVLTQSLSAEIMLSAYR